MSTTMTRKSFLTTAGLAGAGIAALGLAQPAAARAAEASAMADGTYTAVARGFKGDVTVTMTITDGKISELSIEGPNETPDKGGAAINKLTEQILAAGSIDGIDTVSGATFTSSAVFRAAIDCLEQAGILAAGGEVKMKPGIYCGKGKGFDWIEPVQVKIVVDETKLLSVEVIEKELNREEPVIMKAAETFLIPRIVEYQSVDVDAICGATSVSNGIKAATEDALKKALAAGGSDERAIEAFHVAVVPEPEEVELEYDVVVCGMGGAGSAASMSVAESMLASGRAVSVLALETAGKYGGTASNAGTPFGINAPNTLARNGGEPWCAVDTLREDWLNKYSGGRPCKVDCVDLILSESGTTIDWLVDHGFVFTDPQSFFGSDPTWRCGYNYIYKSNMMADIDYAAEYPDYVFTDRSSSVGQYYDHIAADFVAAGGQYMLETTAYELILDENGAAAGVKARNNFTGTNYTIHAKAVILAGGGFAGNTEMCEKYLENEYYPFQNQPWVVWGMHQNKGYMLESAIQQGAATYNIDMPTCVHFKQVAKVLDAYPTYYRDGLEERMQEQNVWSLNDVPTALGFDNATIQVGQDGLRHYNEGGMFAFWQGGPIWYTIHGSDMIDSIAQNGFAGTPGRYTSSTKVRGFGGYPVGRPVPQIYEVLEKAQEIGLAFKGDTLEELAENIGLPVDNFIAQVERYKGYVETGVDEEWGKSDKQLVPCLQYGPYYAIACNPVPYATVAALEVNTDINVLDTDGNPIPGLYACGNDSGGVLYSNTLPYVSYGGVALGWALTSGRLAGKSAVNYLQTL